MDRVRRFARRASEVNVPVLILGETGTGKSLLGKVIHDASPRASGPYLAINCAGIPDSLFESEFFGHQRGAFTGARDGRRGILEQAQGGSLFLDEVGELSTSQQAKLLTALEEGEIRRLGGEGAVRVDVRVLAATSRNLAQEIRDGSFRRELFHRLAVLTCRVPPLRDRMEDVSTLARRFLRKHQERHGRSSDGLSGEAMRYLESRAWPGNVRELSHLLEAALILSEDRVLGVGALQTAGAMADALDVFPSCRLSESQGDAGDPSPTNGGFPRMSRPADGSTQRNAPESLRYAFHGTEEEEREAIMAALARARGNKSSAAREMGMARNTLRQKLRKYGLE